MSDGVSVDRVDFSYKPVHPETGGPVNYLSVQGTTSAPESVQKIIKHVEEISGVTPEIKTLQFEVINASPEADNLSNGNPFYNELQDFFNSDNPSPDQPVALNAVRKTLKNLLGNNLQIQGYWFGITSLPGNCRVPIGPWSLSLEMKSRNEGQEAAPGLLGAIPGQALSTQNVPEFTLKISLNDKENGILINTVNANIGRPVMVGYTRNVSGKYVPGALVIIPDKEFAVAN
jgi:hypothetical protein